MEKSLFEGKKKQHLLKTPVYPLAVKIVSFDSKCAFPKKSNCFLSFTFFSIHTKRYIYE